MRFSFNDLVDQDIKKIITITKKSCLWNSR